MVMCAFLALGSLAPRRHTAATVALTWLGTAHASAWPMESGKETLQSAGVNTLRLFNYCFFKCFMLCRDRLWGLE